MPPTMDSSASTIRSLQNDKRTRADSGAAYSRYYIQDYVEVENLSIQTNSNYVGVVGHGRIISGSLLCSKYNDTGFNRTIALHSTTAVANRFTAIDIVSDSDFDERHKAGASLATSHSLQARPPTTISEADIRKRSIGKTPPRFTNRINFIRGITPETIRFISVCPRSGMQTSLY